MDSVSQFVLGAGIGEVCMGKRIGNKALLLGGIAGTLPDLDVFFTHYLNDPMAYFEWHRSYSHAAFTHFILAFPLAYLCYVLSKKNHPFFSWYLLWFLGMFTHALLDCCTTYGTQLLLPFSKYLVGFNNVSIVDPLYTLPFAVLLVVLMFQPKLSDKRKRLSYWALGVSTGYLLLCVGFKTIAHKHFSASLQKENITCNELSTSPTILNSILWSGIAYNDDVIVCSEYSLLQNKDITWHKYQRNLHLLDSVNLIKDKNILSWFSQGKYFLRQKGNDTIQFYNIKWGRTDFNETDPEKAFIYYFEWIRTNNEWKTHFIQPKMKEGEMSKGLATIWNKILGK